MSSDLKKLGSALFEFFTEGKLPDDDTPFVSQSAETEPAPPPTTCARCFGEGEVAIRGVIAPCPESSCPFRKRG
jgi:hypothetical protein